MAKQKKKVRKIVLGYKHNLCECGQKKLKTSPTCRACYVKNRKQKAISKIVPKVKPKVTKKARPKVTPKVNTKNFSQELEKAKKHYQEALKPAVSFDAEYDMFYLWFGGNRKVDSTIEVSDGMRFDVTRDGLIVSVEMEGLYKYLSEIVRERRKKRTKTPKKANTSKPVRRTAKKNARTKPTTKTRTRPRRKRK